MALNPWLSGQNFQRSEKDLFQSLIDEAIQMKGLDVKYLVRTMDNRDFLFGESPISSFKESFVVEMYLSDITGFNGQSDQFSKFGLMFNDQSTLEVSNHRFKEEAREFGLSRPREGDLLYLPYSDSLFEIKKVEEDENYYQVGKNYRYILKAELFTYSYESFEEGSDESVIGDRLTTNLMADTLGLSANNNAEESDLIREEQDSVISKQFTLDDPYGGK